MQPRNLITVFRIFPKQLFRVNKGPQVKLRVWAPQKYSYEIFAPKGMVEPKALNKATYITPNGATMRPNSPYQQSVVSWRLKGEGVMVYSVPEGTHLPDDLLLVHERGDLYSLQPGKVMSIEELNEKITQFFTTSATVMTKEEWLEAYPEATEE